MSKKEAEIVNEASVEIVGDASTPYESWEKYVEAVESKKEPAPPVAKENPNEKYAFNVDEALDNIDLTFGGYGLREYR